MAKRRTKRASKSRTRKVRKPRRTAAQKRATKRLVAANRKRARKVTKKSSKKSARKPRRTVKQRAATRRLIARNKERSGVARAYKSSVKGRPLPVLTPMIPIVDEAVAKAMRSMSKLGRQVIG